MARSSFKFDPSEDDAENEKIKRILNENRNSKEDLNNCFQRFMKILQSPTSENLNELKKEIKKIVFINLTENQFMNDFFNRTDSLILILAGLFSSINKSGGATRRKKRARLQKKKTKKNIKGGTNYRRNRSDTKVVENWLMEAADVLPPDTAATLEDLKDAEAGLVVATRTAKPPSKPRNILLSTALYFSVIPWLHFILTYYCQIALFNAGVGAMLETANMNTWIQTQDEFIQSQRSFDSLAQWKENDKLNVTEGPYYIDQSQPESFQGDVLIQTPPQFNSNDLQVYVSQTADESTSIYVYEKTLTDLISASTEFEDISSLGLKSKFILTENTDENGTSEQLMFIIYEESDEGNLNICYKLILAKQSLVEFAKLVKTFDDKSWWGRLKDTYNMGSQARREVFELFDYEKNPNTGQLITSNNFKTPDTDSTVIDRALSEVDPEYSRRIPSIVKDLITNSVGVPLELAEKILGEKALEETSKEIERIIEIKNNVNKRQKDELGWVGGWFMDKGFNTLISIADLAAETAGMNPETVSTWIKIADDTDDYTTGLVRTFHNSENLPKFIRKFKKTYRKIANDMASVKKAINKAHMRDQSVLMGVQMLYVIGGIFLFALATGRESVSRLYGWLFPKLLVTYQIKTIKERINVLREQLNAAGIGPVPQISDDEMMQIMSGYLNPAVGWWRARQRLHALGVESVPNIKIDGGRKTKKHRASTYRKKRKKRKKGGKSIKKKAKFTLKRY